MRFVVDEQLPARLATLLRDQGHEAAHIDEIGLGGAKDRAIWNHAVVNGAAVVSKDEDFVDLQRALGGACLGRIRIGNCVNAVLIERGQCVWSEVVDVSVMARHRSRCDKLTDRLFGERRAKFPVSVLLAQRLSRRIL